MGAIVITNKIQNMGRKGTGVMVVDDYINLSISDLNNYGYIRKNKAGIITYKTIILNEVRQELEIISDVIENNKIRVKYFSNGKAMDYFISLRKRPSNLGKGSVYYFVCPVTSKTCSKLYLIKGIFVNRNYYKEMVYETQTLSGRNKLLIRQFNQLMAARKAKELLKSKYFKTHYNHVPTKGYLKALDAIKRGSGINEASLLCGVLC